MVVETIYLECIYFAIFRMVDNTVFLDRAATSSANEIATTGKIVIIFDLAHHLG